MSRSFKRNPGFGWSKKESDKAFKLYEHRRARRNARQMIADDPDAINHPKTYGNPWASPKDGKQWWTGATKKDLTK